MGIAAAGCGWGDADDDGMVVGAGHGATRQSSVTGAAGEHRWRYGGGRRPGKGPGRACWNVVQATSGSVACAFFVAEHVLGRTVSGEPNWYVADRSPQHEKMHELSLLTNICGHRCRPSQGSLSIRAVVSVCGPNTGAREILRTLIIPRSQDKYYRLRTVAASEAHMLYGSAGNTTGRAPIFFLLPNRVRHRGRGGGEVGAGMQARCSRRKGVTFVPLSQNTAGIGQGGEH